MREILHKGLAGSIILWYTIGEEKYGEYKVYHFDYRGSTVVITDIYGSMTDTFAYDTYGNMTEHIGESFVIFGYNGRDGVVTDKNGLIYMRTRYYSPEMRRFINADIIAGEISDSTSLNRYSYVNGNPVSFVDPFGLAVERTIESTNKIIHSLHDLNEGYEFYRNGVKYVKKGDYLIIYGKNDFMHADGITQRRIRIDNLAKYPEIAKYVDPKQVFKTNFANSFDAPGVLWDVLEIVVTTTYDISQYEDVEDKVFVGAYDVATGAVTTVASAAASAGAVALTAKVAAAIGTAVAPGVGTAIGFVVGALVGFGLGALSQWGRDTIIEDAVRNN